jgi:hypothetical protein
MIPKRATARVSPSIPQSKSVKYFRSMAIISV